jgi:hypothetical protein
MSAPRQRWLHRRYILILGSSKTTTGIPGHNAFVNSPNFDLSLIISTYTTPPLVSHAGIEFALSILRQPMTSEIRRVQTMKNENEIFLWIFGAALYVWGMVVFASYLMQSLWLISFQSSRVIQDVADLFF